MIALFDLAHNSSGRRYFGRRFASLKTSPFPPDYSLMMNAETWADSVEEAQEMPAIQIWSVHGWQ
jgi:hypothetical protein